MTKEEIKDELYRMLSDVVNGTCPIRNNTQRGRYREAVKEAVEVLEIFDIYADTAYECGKHANKWIPVSERLPEEDGRYIAYIENGRLSYIMICDYYVGQTWCPDDETASNNVTYWMPLPIRPYKESEE